MWMREKNYTARAGEKNQILKLLNLSFQIKKMAC